jgi:hypothetical protein
MPTIERIDTSKPVYVAEILFVPGIECDEPAIQFFKDELSVEEFIERVEQYPSVADVVFGKVWLQ